MGGGSKIIDLTKDQIMISLYIIMHVSYYTNPTHTTYNYLWIISEIFLLKPRFGKVELQNGVTCCDAILLVNNSKILIISFFSELLTQINLKHETFLSY